MNDIKVFACNSAEEFTKEICDNLGIEMGQKDSFKFANDNNFVQLKETVREKDVYIVQTTQPPVNERIMELLITVEAAKRAADQFIDYFDTIVDLNERDNNGKPVFQAEKVMKEMATLHKVHEELVTLEEQVKKELTEQSTVRGGATDGFDPGDF